MRRFLSQIVFRIVECEQTMILLSRAMDEPIGVMQRLAIRCHCLCCPGCSNYRNQLPLLRSAFRQIDNNIDLERVATFTAEEKGRLAKLLRNAEDKP